MDLILLNQTRIISLDFFVHFINVHMRPRNIIWQDWKNKSFVVVICFSQKKRHNALGGTCDENFRKQRMAITTSMSIFDLGLLI